MRPALPLLAMMALAGCLDPRTAPDADLRTRQQAACITTIAAHVKRPEADVTSRWLSETNGTAIVETIDSGRRHLCRVDASARVTSYSHPRN